MWTWHTDTGLPEGQYSKHIYLGETRIVTKQTSKLDISYGQSDEYHHRYYYHPDHLGSAQLVTDYEGNEYQRIEYTPYGELWVEKKSKTEEGLRFLPYKFTAKEQDEETGLYYYGARYLDAKYSRWLSTDPAVGEYIPQTPVSDEAKKYNQSLPGQGGIFNIVNLQLYHYAGNNPVKYTDPDGKKLTLTVDKSEQSMNTKFEIGGATLINFNSKVTTHVVPDGDTTQDPAANVNTNQRDASDGSFWTQYPNGTWKITEVKQSDKTKKDSQGKTEADKYGSQQLRTSASQLLPVYDSDGNPVLNEDGSQKTTRSSGYNVHATGYSNTAGCVGVFSKFKMWLNVKLFQLNEKIEKNTSIITVQD
ncbi:RHS repeat-associated core domain-containing protein [Treponema parvum]|nr:RHS repeat-associated core domain-containing protein [Treponema parvum]